MADAVLVRQFVSAVYAGVEGFADVRALSRPEQAFFRFTDHEGLEAFVKPRRDHKNIYIGVAARLSDQSGELTNCGALTALFADVDFKDLAEPAARASLARAPLAPSIVVQSGGGLQPWWLLKEPLDLQREAAEAKRWLRRLARYLGADLAAAEPARILRLPNTFNHKYTPRRPVRVEVFEPSRRYNVSEFGQWLPDEPEPRILSGPTPDAIPAGSRNTYLTSQAGSMRKRHMSEAGIVAALLAENASRCRPPLPDADVRGIAASVARYAPDPANEPTAFVRGLPELIERAATQTEPRWLVEGLVPGDGSVLLHSQPREYKTLIAQALLIAVTTGTPAFGMDRLTVAAPAPAWYITEEDGWWRVTSRFQHLLQGYGLTQAPDLLHVSAGQGISLDATEWQERIIATARAEGYRLVVLDPLRSLTDTADQGPRELKPFALFMRRFMRETSAVVLIVHHDTKPPATPAADQRRRPQRASGGGIFSIADSPISVDRVDETRRMLVPCAYKFAADPAPVTVHLEQGPGWLRLTGGESTADQPHDAALDLRILAFLTNSPYTFGNKVAAGVKGRKDLVLERLKALAGRGLVDSVHDGRGVKWFTNRAS